MRSASRRIGGIGVAIAATAVLLVAAAPWAGSAPATAVAAAPQAAVAAGVRPAVLPLVTLSSPVNLCALAGTKTMADGEILPIWGFAEDLDPATAGDCTDDVNNIVPVPDLPGPTIDVALGGSVTVNLDNLLAEPVSIQFLGQDVAPDMVGAPAGGTTSYTFTASNPGTFLYEAGLDVTQQVPMGLYGAMVVRPAPGQAYGLSTTFHQEALLVLSEVDADLNMAVDPDADGNDTPAGFDMRDHDPDYWLINGTSYTNGGDLDPIATAAAGDQVLIRYVNAGLVHHSMELLGTHQHLIATDAFELPFPFDVVSHTVPAGATADTIATMPGTGSFPLFERNLHLTTGAEYPAVGGMLSFIEVA